MEQQLKITPEMVKNGKNIKCDECGNLTFIEKITFKKISSILSPTGKDEVIPMPIIVCDKCGKVSKIFDPQGLVPKELKANKPSSEKSSKNLKIVR